MFKKCPKCGEEKDIYFRLKVGNPEICVCGTCGYEQSEMEEDICPCCGEKENITIIHERICNNCGINF